MWFCRALPRRELARDLVAQVWPEPLRPLGIKFFLVSIGPPPRAREFCALTGFPEDHLLADPDNVLYDALGMRKDVASTFFNIAVRATPVPKKEPKNIHGCFWEYCFSCQCKADCKEHRMRSLLELLCIACFFFALLQSLGMCSRRPVSHATQCSTTVCELLSQSCARAAEGHLLCWSADASVHLAAHPEGWRGGAAQRTCLLEALGSSQAGPGAQQLHGSAAIYCFWSWLPPSWTIV